MNNEHPYWICRSCASKEFPHADPLKMRGITCVLDTPCGYCGKTTAVCPVRDYEYASGKPGVDWD
jgi:hypothetical protein